MKGSADGDSTIIAQSGKNETISNDEKALNADSFDFIPITSNRCDMSEVEASACEDGAEARRALGYDAKGNLGGPYSENNPPPGMEFSAYRKGCTGVAWRKREATEKKVKKTLV